MNIKEFISKYKNHPILFVGTGISLRYLKNSFSWDGLLSYISFELTNDEEFYLDLKAKCFKNGKYNFEEIANLLEKEFNLRLSKDRDGKFKNINDRFYQSMKDGVNLSRFKIFISDILSIHPVLSFSFRLQLMQGRFLRTSWSVLLLQWSGQSLEVLPLGSHHHQ